MLDPAKDEAVHQGGLDAAVVGPGRDDDKVCTDLVACFAHTQEKQIENRIPQRIGHTPIARRHDANTVEFASAQKPAFGIGPEITEFARCRFDPLTQLQANQLRVVEYIRGRAPGDPCGLRHIN